MYNGKWKPETVLNRLFAQQDHDQISYRCPFAVAAVWRLESAAVDKPVAVQIHGLIWKSSLTLPASFVSTNPSAQILNNLSNSSLDG